MAWGIEEFMREGKAQRLPAGLRRVAMRKLKILNYAQLLEACGRLLETGWNCCTDHERVSTAFASTTSFACAFSGRPAKHTR